jgi:hypothetical protein
MAILHLGMTDAPLRLSCQLYDGFRHLKSYGRWSWTGMTYEEIWDKYERQIREELGPGAEEPEVNRCVALRILYKSCQTNKMFDHLGSIQRAQDVLYRASAQENFRRATRPRGSGGGKKMASSSSSSSSSSSANPELDAFRAYLGRVGQASQLV